jgi:fumarate hydratase subunit beta
MKKLTLPLTKEAITSLQCGETVLLTGVVYTARDAAHAKMAEALRQDEPLPFDLRQACIFYAGPCPAMPGQVMNSCGPTTSKRMDAYAPMLYQKGVQCVLGKGPVAEEVKQAIVQNHCVYFTLTGGAGALLARSIKKSKLVAYEELGAEAVRELWVEDFPATVAVDTFGNDIFIEGPKAYKK